MTIDDFAYLLHYEQGYCQLFEVVRYKDFIREMTSGTISLISMIKAKQFVYQPVSLEKP